MKIEIDQFKDYIEKYILLYKEQYNKLTDSPPIGGGFPKLPISPYLSPKNLQCIILEDGIVIYEKTKGPDYEWYITGGPALKIDYEPTVIPREIHNILINNGLYGKDIGIFRVVSKTKLSDLIWRGDLGVPEKTIKLRINQVENISIFQFGMSLNEALRRLTYGAFCGILNIFLKNEESDFWQPYIIRNIGFFPADLNSKGFYNYLEIIPHVNHEAWDLRSIKCRVKIDVRRDFVSMFTRQYGKITGGTISFVNENDQIDLFNSVLQKIDVAINDFERLLQLDPEAEEKVFHNFLEENTILLDIYGSVESKPKLTYPKGEKSPVGKKYLIPDFIISYRDQSYKLIELERPSKEMATKLGHPKQDYNQAAFQTGEWMHYIKNHYSEIKSRYPGIASKCRTSVIMSRNHQKQFPIYNDLRKYIEMIKETSAVDEILTYDDLLEKSKEMYYKLSVI